MSLDEFLSWQAVAKLTVLGIVGLFIYVMAKEL